MPGPLFLPALPKISVPIVVNPLTTRQSTADQQSYTLSGTFGTPSTDRLIVGFPTSRSAGWLPSNGVTIGGVSATRAVSTDDDTHAGPNAIIGAWFYAVVPSNTTQTVQVTFASSGFCCGFHLFEVFNAKPVHLSVGVDKTNAAVSASNSLTGIVIPRGGIALSAFARFGTVGAVAWTGVTETDDRQIGDDIRTSAGYFATDSGDSSRTITASYASGGGSKIMSVIVFEPA